MSSILQTLGQNGWSPGALVPTPRYVIRYVRRYVRTSTKPRNDTRGQRTLIRNTNMYSAVDVVARLRRTLRKDVNKAKERYQ